MIKPKLSLRNFFQKQAEEETDEGPVTVDETDQKQDNKTPDDDPEGEESENRDDTQDSDLSDDQTNEDEPTSEPTAELLHGEATETIRLAELSQLRTKAQEWDNVQAELMQLRTWYATQKQGVKLPKGDVSDHGATGQKSWERAPWNQ